MIGVEREFGEIWVNGAKVVVDPGKGGLNDYITGNK